MGKIKIRPLPPVEVGQVWRNTTRGYRVEVMEILGGVASCFNLDSSRRTRIATHRFSPHCHWELLRKAPSPVPDALAQAPTLS